MKVLQYLIITIVIAFTLITIARPKEVYVADLPICPAKPVCRMQSPITIDGVVIDDAFIDGIVGSMGEDE